jgi:D-arabinose 1-dehydrogenase-like Zn-dependent alcohol dehydrogenase
MSKMDAVVLPEWGGDLSVERTTVPEPEPNEVRVAVRACGVTRTVENAIQGGLDDDPSLTPRVPGHEFAGVVDAVGDAVTTHAVGDRILAYFYLVCGQCDACRRGAANRCTNFEGWLGVNAEGAYAEYATIPAANALPMPDDLSFPAGAIAADGLATPLHICDRTDVGDEDTVLVIGAAGRLGVHLCQLAARRGAHVLAADVRDDRLAHVDDVTGPAVRPVDASDSEFAATLRAETPVGDGPTVAVDTVGDIPTLEAAWDALAMGGQVVTLTTHHERSFAPLLKDYVVKEASVVGSRYATQDEVVRAARLLADERVSPVVTDTVGLSEVPSVHADIRAGETYGMTVLDPTR